MASNTEQFKTLMFDLIFAKLDVDKAIEQSQILIDRYKTVDDEITADNELSDEGKQETLKRLTMYNMTALYDNKFYKSLKNRDVDTCLKIIKLMKPLMSDIINHCDDLGLHEEGLSNQEYLTSMNALKLKYEIMIDYEKTFEMIKKIENKFEESIKPI